MKKSYKILISHKLPNGSIASLEFLTEMEEDIPDTELFEKVYTSTWNDLRESVRKDKIAAKVFTGISTGIKFQEKLDANSDG